MYAISLEAASCDVLAADTTAYVMRIYKSKRLPNYVHDTVSDYAVIVTGERK